VTLWQRGFVAGLLVRAMPEIGAGLRRDLRFMGKSGLRATDRNDLRFMGESGLRPAAENGLRLMGGS
jgi:hypothetical protein